jgi:hypothetical protein
MEVVVGFTSLERPNFIHKIGSLGFPREGSDAKNVERPFDRGRNRTAVVQPVKYLLYRLSNAGSNVNAGG